MYHQYITYQIIYCTKLVYTDIFETICLCPCTGMHFSLDVKHCLSLEQSLVPNNTKRTWGGSSVVSPNVSCAPCTPLPVHKNSQCSHSNQIVCFSTVNPVISLGLASFCCAFQGLYFSVAFLCCSLVSDSAEITVTAGGCSLFQ